MRATLLRRKIGRGEEFIVESEEMEKEKGRKELKRAFGRIGRKQT